MLCEKGNSRLGTIRSARTGEKWKWLSLSDSLRPHGLYSPWNSPGQNTRVGSLSLHQVIFPTQESNPGLLHCRWILYQVSYLGRYHIIHIRMAVIKRQCQKQIWLVVCLCSFQFVSNFTPSPPPAGLLISKNFRPIEFSTSFHNL